MKLIGYWIRSLDDTEFVPPQELVTEYDHSTRQRISDYLDAGSEFAVYRGMSWCRFFCESPMGSCELTDGKWVWPEGLSHYVRDHSVRLPDDFVDRVYSKTRSNASAEFRRHCSAVDESFWIEWCSEHRSNLLRSKLEAARSHADAEAQQLKADSIAEREQSDGVSEATCRFAGCNNRALAGGVFCAACVLEPEWAWRLRSPYMNLESILTD